MLLGRSFMKKGEKYLFISGMVEIKDFRFRASDDFSQQMWNSIYTEIKEHFTDLEILGWFYAKAEIPPVCTEQIRGIHGKNFAGNDKLLYLYEEGEDEDAVFLSMAGTLEQQQGYYIYYEKNPEMQEYMISHKKPVSIDSQFKEHAVGSIREVLEQKQEEKEARQAKTSYGLVVALALLAVLCGWMAMKNQTALTKVETQVSALKATMGFDDGASQEKNTMVETLAGNVATVTPAAVTATPEVSPAAMTAVPEASASPIVIAKKYDYYIVKEGDTLSKIASRYYSDVAKAETIRKYNKLKKDSVILVGQKLKLPIN